LDNRNSDFRRGSLVSAKTANWSAGGDAIGDDGADDNAICEPEAGGAVVATCGFTEGRIA
jgi:hypothetical protein